jgi:zinc transport system substrate-binding protein
VKQYFPGLFGNGLLQTLSFLLWYNFPVISIVRLTVLVLFVLLFNSYSCKKPESIPEDKISVLTTILPLYCFTINITGDAAHVENLLPSGVGPHEYSLSPGDAKRVAAAQVIIKNGVHLETWLDKALGISGSAASESGKIIVDTSRGINIIDGDPHIWLSPKNAMIQVQNIRDALVRVDPDNRKLYEKNAASYLKDLKSLDGEIRDDVQQWSSREIVSFRPAFKYLVKEYGLVQAAVIQKIPDIEPSPKHIVDVTNIIKERKINVIFTEPRISHKMVDALAHDLHLQVYSLDTLETGRPEPTWYIDTMRANIAILGKALNRKP